MTSFALTPLFLLDRELTRLVTALVTVDLVYSTELRLAMINGALLPDHHLDEHHTIAQYFCPK